MLWWRLTWIMRSQPACSVTQRYTASAATLHALTAEIAATSVMTTAGFVTSSASIAAPQGERCANEWSDHANAAATSTKTANRPTAGIGRDTSGSKPIGARRKT